MLTRVTITGADNNTPIQDIFEITKEFPFVEWGILVSETHNDEPRWPGLGWQGDFMMGCRQSPMKIDVAMHACGRMVKNLLRDGSPSYTPPIRFAAGRVQINTHAEAHVVTDEFFTFIRNRNTDLYPREWIFQLDGVNNYLLNAAHAMGISCSGLFDGSHGAGKLPVSWPLAIPGLHCGYAGGLGPDNVEAQLHKISEAAVGPYWIDMERQVRTEDDSRLDLDKVRRVLEICARWISGPEEAGTA